MRIFKNLLFLSALSAAVALTGLTGCKSSKSPAAAQAARDKNITQQVKKALRDDPAFKFTEVDAKTMNGTVQLSGFAGSEATKRRAEDLARRVPGVSDVQDNIVLKPSALAPTGRTNELTQPQVYPETQPK